MSGSALPCPALPQQPRLSKERLLGWGETARRGKVEIVDTTRLEVTVSDD